MRNTDQTNLDENAIASNTDKLFETDCNFQECGKTIFSRIINLFICLDVNCYLTFFIDFYLLQD